MKRVMIGLAIAALLAGATQLVQAKRIPPPEVKPVIHNGIKYTAPRQHMGCVEARSAEKNGMCWMRQIYVVKYDLDLERDVQDVFIKDMALKNGALVITNERGHEYHLNLDDLTVKVIKGSLIQSRP
jgi:hypothetical protein